MAIKSLLEIKATALHTHTHKNLYSAKIIGQIWDAGTENWFMTNLVLLKLT